MSVLLLRLSAPLQAWGDGSRFNQRETRKMPTKSGVVGLLAAAEGRRRSDTIEDLAGLRFGARADQLGPIVEDFQTEIDWTASSSSKGARPLTRRRYLSDSRFLAAVEGPEGVIEGLARAVRAPVFPVFLGRRSCPPAGRLFWGIRDGDLESALRETEWLAADSYRRAQPARVDLAVSRDARPGERSDEFARDLPLSFHPDDRRHDQRAVVHEWVTVRNANRRDETEHDPLALAGGV